METKFQTSFIPKRPLTVGSMAGTNMGVQAPRPKRTGSLFLNLAILIFVISLGAGGAVYAWKTVLLSNQNSYKQQLADRQKQFNPTLIQQLRQTNAKIDDAKRLLGRHVALSNIFDIISKLTIENVRFLSLDVTTPSVSQGGMNAGSSAVKIALSGYGTNLPAVAFQAKVLSELEKYDLRNIVKNPAISEPSFDSNGAISFGITADIDPQTLIYMNGAGNAAPSSPGNQ